MQSFKPEGGTLWLHQILELYWESIETAINYSNLTSLVIHLNYRSYLPYVHALLSVCHPSSV